MKPLLATLTLCLSTLPAMATTTLARWDFNSDDGLVNTGSLTPSEGAGTLSLTGGTSGLFTSGSPIDPAGFPLDSGWSVGGYPAQGTLSGTAGPTQKPKSNAQPSDTGVTKESPRRRSRSSGAKPPSGPIRMAAGSPVPAKASIAGRASPLATARPVAYIHRVIFVSFATSIRSGLSNGVW